MHLLSRVVQHCVWANESWIGFLDERASYPYAITRMSHILLGERAWFQRIAGAEPDRQVWQALTVEELRALQRRHEATYHDLLEGGLERVVPFTRFTGEQYQLPVADILVHLATHGAHHRGQIAAYVSSVGLRPVNTDFVQFCIVRFGK